MSCIVNPDLCPKDGITKNCTKQILDLCPAKNYKEFKKCLTEHKSDLKKRGCYYNWDNLPDCFLCNLLANSQPPYANSNLSSICTNASFGPKICENAVWLGQAFDLPLNCCKWNLPPPPPPPPPINKKAVIIGSLGGLFVIIVIGLIIWLVVRNKSKKKIK